MHKVLVIGGFDPSGGAGLQIDLLTLTELGVFPFTVATAVTIQNSKNVSDVYALPSKIILEQIQTILQDGRVDAIKIGMLGTEKNVLTIADFLNKTNIKRVIDPVFQASKDFPLLSPDAIPAFKEHLLPLATVLTPNLMEAQKLVGFAVRSKSRMKTAAQALHKLGPKWVLVKGGHLAHDKLTDILYNGKDFFEFPHERVRARDVRGTGCIFSSALTGFLASGHSVPEATQLAQEYTLKKIKTALKIGKGRPQAWL